MAELDFNKDLLEYLIDSSISAWASLYNSKVLERVPRDWERAPNPIRFKGVRKWKPQRNVRSGNKRVYRAPVYKNWQWYEWVTWALRRSIWLQKLASWEYIVGVRAGPTEVYAAAQEFWNNKLPARSYLREPLRDNQQKIEAQIQKTFNELSNRLW